MSVDDITAQILTVGRGTLMAKIDIKNAYRNIPVHPSDRHLLGMEWQNQLYVDGALPFGLRSAPKIFNTIADVGSCDIAELNMYSTIWTISLCWGTLIQWSALRGCQSLNTHVQS